MLYLTKLDLGDNITSTTLSLPTPPQLLKTGLGIKYLLSYPCVRDNHPFLWNNGYIITWMLHQIFKYSDKLMPPFG